MILKKIVSRIDQIYQYVFPKVVVLKRSTKGAMSSSFSFFRATYSYSCLLSEKMSTKISFLNEAPVLLLTANVLSDTD